LVLVVLVWLRVFTVALLRVLCVLLVSVLVCIALRGFIGVIVA